MDPQQDPPRPPDLQADPSASVDPKPELPKDPETGKHLPPVSGRFPPGVSGNPGGKKKGTWSVRRAIQRLLAEGTDPEDPDLGGTRTQALARRAMEAALGSRPLTKDERAILAWVVENAEGKLSQHHQIEGALPVKRVILEDGQAPA